MATLRVFSSIFIKNSRTLFSRINTKRVHFSAITDNHRHSLIKKTIYVNGWLDFSKENNISPLCQIFGKRNLKRLCYKRGNMSMKHVKKETGQPSMMHKKLKLKKYKKWMTNIGWLEPKFYIFFGNFFLSFKFYNIHLHQRGWFMQNDNFCSLQP